MGELELSAAIITAGRSLSGVFLVCLVLVALLACQPAIPPPPAPTPVPTLSGTRLAFETVEQRDQARGADYEQPQPGLAVIAGLADLDREPLYVSPETIETLASLDFDRYIGLIVYQGGKPSTGFGVTIQEIVVRDAQVIVVADFETPAPDQEVGAEETSPFHVVTVERGALTSKVTFVLMDARTREVLLEREVILDE